MVAEVSGVANALARADRLACSSGFPAGSKTPLEAVVSRSAAGLFAARAG
jgi:hypothetical protein